MKRQRSSAPPPQPLERVTADAAAGVASEDDESTVEMISTAERPAKRSRAERDATRDAEWAKALDTLRRRRFTVDYNAAHVHPRDAMLRFDNDAHRYQVAGDRRPYCSVTEAVKRLGVPFNAHFARQAIVKKAAAARAPVLPAVPPPPPAQDESKETPPTPTPLLPRYRDVQTDADVDAKFQEARERGTRRHDYFERFTLGDAALTDAEVRAEVPLAFVRFWRTHPELEPWRSEWRIYDEDMCLSGTLDMMCRVAPARPGAPPTFVVLDWKNYLPSAVFAEADRALLTDAGFVLPPGVTGSGAHRSRKMSHPLLAHLPACRLVEAAVQLNLYRHMLATRYGDVGRHITELWMVVFPPDMDGDAAAAEGHYIFRVPIMDMAAVGALFPWDDQDVRHIATPETIAATFCLDYIRPDDDEDASVLEEEDEDEEDGGGDSDASWDAYSSSSSSPPASSSSSVAANPNRVRVVALDTAATLARPGHVWVGAAYDKWQLAESPWVGPKTYASTMDSERILLWRGYERQLLQDHARLSRLVPELGGKTLVCWCPRRRGSVEDACCHARVLAKYTNALLSGRARLRLPPATNTKTKTKAKK